MSTDSPANTTYSVRANPVLHDFGELDGQLNYVRFTADHGTATHKEWQVEAAHLDQTLHTLESSGLRYGILNKLRSGARVELPGTYTTHQLTQMGLPPQTL